MDRHYSKMIRGGWYCIVCLALGLTTLMWTQLQSVQDDNVAIVVEFARTLESGATKINNLQYELMQSQLEISYYKGCLTGSAGDTNLVSLSEDLARAREFTLELIDSTRKANRKHK